MTTRSELVSNLRALAAAICKAQDGKFGSAVRLLTQAANEIVSLEQQRNQWRNDYNEAERILRRFENKTKEYDPGPEWDKWRVEYEDGLIDPPPSATNPETGIQYGDIE